MKKLMLFCMAIAMVALVAAPAYAEVQNVKVGGDITIRGVSQNVYDLNRDNEQTTVGIAGRGIVGNGDESVTGFMTTLGLNVDADLTDNVAATIRLVGERDWSSSYETLDSTMADFTPVGAGSTSVIRGLRAPAFDGVQIDLAYITLKELLYSPLTLIIGRQDLWYGDGFIIGANLRPRAIMAPEMTDFRSFDAIRAILDYDPWTVDMFYSRVDTGNFVRRDDNYVVGDAYEDALVDDSENIEVWGIDVGYVFDQYNAEAEAYYFGQTVNNLPFWSNQYRGDIRGAPSSKVNTVHIIGARGSFEPIDNLDIRLEAAGELGTVDVGLVRVQRNTVGVKAGAADVSAAYTWVDWAWLPRLAVEWVYMSGESNPRNGAWNGWINFYRGKFFSAIHEWQGVYYQVNDVATSGAAGNAATANNNAWTNQHTVIIDGSIQPLDDILCEVRYLHFMSDKPYGRTNNNIAARSQHIGDEVDMRLTYDYTEDVTFGMLTAWFFPGQYFLGTQANNFGNDIASEIVGSVALTF